MELNLYYEDKLIDSLRISSTNPNINLIELRTELIKRNESILDEYFHDVEFVLEGILPSDHSKIVHQFDEFQKNELFISKVKMNME